jgi:hypothetical protein
MLRVNHNIRSLSLRNNNIGAHPLHLVPVDIAYSMTFNKGLLEFDLEGNPIDRKWFDPNRVIEIEDQPLGSHPEPQHIPLTDQDLLPKHGINGTGFLQKRTPRFPTLWL